MLFYPSFPPLPQHPKDVVKVLYSFVIVLLYVFSLLIIFLLYYNLFCKIVLLVKRVYHFDRKKSPIPG